MGRALQFMVIAAAAAAAIVPVPAVAVERVYSTGLYPWIQRVLTPLSNLLPFAVFDLLTLTAAIALFLVIFRALRRAARERRMQPLMTALMRILTAAAVVYLVFLAFWGLNYRRIAMPDRLVLEREPPSTEEVMALGFESIRRMNALHDEAHRLAWDLDPRADPRLVEAYGFVQQALSGLPARAVPGRLKRTIYGPYFRWTSVDGMVDPFALEVLANPDLLPYERTFVAAHEWAHLAGFADEAEANFVAWLTCVRAGPAAQYSGWLSLYWQVGGEVSADNRRRLWNEVAEGPRADILAITERLRRGQLPFLRNASWRVYDQYLRANRVEEGIRSYGEVITLIHRARFEDGWAPVRRTSELSR